jgi:hypothetical protein
VPVRDLGPGGMGTVWLAADQLVRRQVAVKELRPVGAENCVTTLTCKVAARLRSGLWSGQPVSIKLGDLDAICTLLGCEVGDLLIPELGTLAAPGYAGPPAA